MDRTPVNHRDYEPGCDCPGSLQFRYQTDGRRPFDVWECDACGLTNCPAVARRLREVWRHLTETGRIQQTETETGVRQMKFTLSIYRKGSVPGSFGSEGPGASLEFEIDDKASVQQILDTAASKYDVLEEVVDRRLEKMLAKATAQLAVRQPASEPPPSGARAFQEDPRPEPPSLPQYSPPTPRHRAEPGYDDEPPRGQEPPQQPQNGYGGRNGQRDRKRNDQQSGWKGDDPTSPGGLWKYASTIGQQDFLKRLAKSWGYDRVVDFSSDDIAAAVHELHRKLSGSRGGN